MWMLPPRLRFCSSPLRHFLPLVLCCVPLLTLRTAGAQEVLADPPSESAHEFTLLSYNVHGLPPVTSGGWWMGQRLERIRRAFSTYPVVLLQEDFATRSALAKGGQWLVHHGPGRRWRWGHLLSAPVWIPCWLTTLCGNPPIVGSGLTTQVRRDHFRDVEPLVSRHYEKCRGYLTGGSDCFAAKGFTGTRLRLPQGMVVDVYNTHLDAGNSKRDLAVRWEQIRDLARAVAGHSPDAIIVAGDLNSNLTGGDRGDDFAPVLGLLDGLDLRDASARPLLGSEWKVMDYILFRSGPRTQLTLAPAPFEPVHGPAPCGPRGRASGEDDCFQNRHARPLSDHPALFAHFRASLRQPRFVEEAERDVRRRLVNTR